MTNRIETLKQLQARLRESKGADLRLDAEVYIALTGGAYLPSGMYPTASLDACVALLNARFPGALWATWNMEHGPGCRLLCPGESGGYSDGPNVETPEEWTEWTPVSVCHAMVYAIVSAVIEGESRCLMNHRSIAVNAIRSLNDSQSTPAEKE